MKKSEDHLVVQSNALVESYYKLSLNPQKLLRLMLSKITPTENELEKRFFTMSLEETKNIIESQDKNFINYIRGCGKQLIESCVEVKRSKNGFLLATWCASFEWIPAKDCFEFEFSSKLQTELIKLLREFVSYELKNISGLRSQYSIRLYELLRQYLNTDLKERIIGLDELKAMLGIEKKQYERLNDFKRYVLEVAKKELPRKTDIAFTYMPLKTGRKVTSIRFLIKANVPDYLLEKISDEILNVIPSKFRQDKDLLEVVIKFIGSKGEHYVKNNVMYVNSKQYEDYSAYIKSSLKNNFAKNWDYRQLLLFEDGLKEGAKVVFDGSSGRIIQKGSELFWISEDGNTIEYGKSVMEALKAGRAFFPVDTNKKALRLESEKCWKNCFGNCGVFRYGSTPPPACEYCPGRTKNKQGLVTDGKNDQN